MRLLPFVLRILENCMRQIDLILEEVSEATISLDCKVVIRVL
jgi:hypothetical protein